MKDKKFIFIFGSQRSGTTLLFNVLSKHSEIKATPNDLNLVTIFNGDKNALDSNKKKLVEWRLMSLDLLFKIFSDVPHKQSLKFIFTKYFNRYKEQICLHKIPKGEFDLDYYRETFSNALYIYVIRNPLAILASRKYWKLSNPKFKLWKSIEKQNLTFSGIKKYGYFFRKHLLEVLNSFVIIDKNSRKFDTLKIVDYEDLVTCPDKVIIDILSSIDLEYYYKLYFSIRQLANPYTSYSDLKNKQGIYTNSLDNWKTKLTLTEKWLMRNEIINFFSNYNFNSEVLKNHIKEYLIAIDRDLEIYYTQEKKSWKRL